MAKKRFIFTDFGMSLGRSSLMMTEIIFNLFLQKLHKLVKSAEDFFMFWCQDWRVPAVQDCLPSSWWQLYIAGSASKLIMYRQLYILASKLIMLELPTSLELFRWVLNILQVDPRKRINYFRPEKNDIF